MYPQATNDLFASSSGLQGTAPFPALSQDGSSHANQLPLAFPQYPQYLQHHPFMPQTQIGMAPLMATSPQDPLPASSWMAAVAGMDAAQLNPFQGMFRFDGGQALPASEGRQTTPQVAQGGQISRASQRRQTCRTARGGQTSQAAQGDQTSQVATGGQIPQAAQDIQTSAHVAQDEQVPQAAQVAQTATQATQASLERGKPAIEETAIDPQLER